MIPPALFFLLGIALAPQGFLWFHTKFRIICSGFVKYAFELKRYIIYFLGFVQHWVCAVLGLSLVMVSGGPLSSCGVWSSHFSGFSCSGTWALEHGLSGAWAQLSLGVYNLPGLGIKPVSPTLVGRFLTTRPPGKSAFEIFIEVTLN